MMKENDVIYFPSMESHAGRFSHIPTLISSQENVIDNLCFMANEGCNFFKHYFEHCFRELTECLYFTMDLLVKCFLTWVNM